MMRQLLILALLLTSACSAALPTGHDTGSGPLSLDLGPAGDEEESAMLGVALADPDRSVQTLPGTWDTATLRLEHATMLTQPRLRTLTKGVELVANGSGGYVANGAFGGKLRPKSGYTLIASLWNGGVNGTLAGEKKTTVTLLSGANNLVLPIEVYPTLGVSGFTPASGIENDVITLQGQAFSVLPGYDKATIGGLAATVSAASSVSLTVTMPDVGPDSYSWQVQVGSSLAARSGFTVPGIVGPEQNWIALGSHQKDPAIAWGSNRYLVVWYDDRDSSKTDVFGRMVGTDGATLVTDFNITNATTATQQRPYAAYSPSKDQFLVVWQESPNGNDVQAQLVNSNGTLSGSQIPIAVLSGAQIKPQVTYNTTSNEYMVVWTDNRNGNNDVYGQRVSSTGTMVGGTLALLTGSGSQDDVGIAYSTTSGKYLVVYKDDVPAKRVIRGLLVNADGSLALGPIEISGLTSFDQVSPAVCTDSTTGDFLVVWAENNTPQLIKAQRVSSSGTLVGSIVTLSNATGNKNTPRLAYEPWRQKFVVVWNDNRNSSSDIYGQYVSIGGALWGANFPVNIDAGNQTPCEVAVSPTAQRGLVAYQDAANGGDVYGQVVR